MSSEESSDDESTSSKKAVDFPDDNDAGDDEKAVKNWGEVPKKKWFLVERVKDVKTTFGPTKKLTLKDRENVTIITWSTKMINETISDKMEEMGEGGSLFIKSIGKKRCEGAKKHLRYYQIKYKVVV